MTLVEFEKQIITAAVASSICDIPIVVRVTPTAIKLRIGITNGDFVDAFHNEQTGTTAYALIRGTERIFGADNAGGWHIHPFVDPTRHDPSSAPITFVDFVAEIERRSSQNTRT